MPSPNPKALPQGFETGPGPLHYKLRSNTVDKDKVGMRYLADGTEAPVFLDKCGRRMPVVPDIARKGWVKLVYQVGAQVGKSAGMAAALVNGEREAWGGETLGMEWGWSCGGEIGHEKRVW